MKILLVCTGNTCRSSMAEGIMRSMLEDMGKISQGVEIYSAGLAALPNQLASKHAIEVMKEDNIDLTKHRSKQVTDTMVEQSDLILTMTKAHKDAIVSRWSNSTHKTYTLKEYTQDNTFSDKMDKELEDLYIKIDSKREGFLEEYKEDIKKLREERLHLKRRIEDIDLKLKDLEAKFQQSIDEEKRRIIELEERVGGPDIIDPFGGTQKEYRNCAKDIRDNIKVAVKKIVEQLLHNDDNIL